MSTFLKASFRISSPVQYSLNVLLPDVAGPGLVRVQQTGVRCYGEALRQGRGAELRDQKTESNDW